MSFLAILEVLNFEFDKFGLFFKSQIYQNSNLRVSEIVKMVIFEIQIFPKSILHKIDWQIDSWSTFLKLKLHISGVSGA